MNTKFSILQKNTIDIWQFPIENDNPDALSLLDNDEKTRAQRFYFDRHRIRFVNARATLKLIIANYLKINPRSISFNYGHHGKPFLTHASEIQFNLSHSGNIAVVAIGKCFPIGIDVEFFSARPYEDLGRHLFSPAEIKQLEKISNTLKPLIFFNIWAQKEAFIKANGLGMSYPTDKFTVSTLIKNIYTIEDSIYRQTWKMLSFTPQIAAQAAVCFHPDVNEINFKKLLANEINYTA